jgi:hypothetical protein
VNTPNQKTFQYLLALAGGLVFALALAAESSDVMSRTKRQLSLDQAKKLLAVREVSPTAADHDPFHPAAFAELVTGLSHVPSATPSGGDTATSHAPAGPRSNRDLLQAIASSLKPSGYFILGSQPTLVFGQKKVKAGGTLTITFEGSEYILEITAIERTNFTLRLNREEFTRPIK